MVLTSCGAGLYVVCLPNRSELNLLPKMSDFSLFGQSLGAPIFRQGLNLEKIKTW